MAGTADEYLDGLMARPYAIRLWRKERVFVAGIDELSLFAEGETADGAVLALEARKRDYFQAMLELGRADRIRPPEGQETARRFWREVAPFTFKALVAGTVGLLVFLAVVPAIHSQVKQLGGDARVAGRQFPQGLAEGFENLAAMPADRQERAIAGVRRFLESVAPVLREGKMVLVEQGVLDAPPEPAR